MKLGRVSIGINKKFVFEYSYSLCECHILELGFFYIEWLSKYCAYQGIDE